MIETITSLVAIASMSAIALGVGSSTIAIASFITALRDGTIDQTERTLLGVIYIFLRISMVLIILTTLFLAWQNPALLGDYIAYVYVLVALLFVNAFCMTKHYISMKIGPAIQAGTWYTLGFVTTIDMLNLFPLAVQGFIVLYVIDVLIAITILNGYLVYFKRKSHT